MSLKQKYLHEKGPFPFNFEQERIRMFNKIINLLDKFDRNNWTVSAFNFGSLLQNYKQVYGLASDQLQTLLLLLTNIFFIQNDSSIQPRLIILKLLNRLIDQQIQITDNFKIDNSKLMNIIIDRINNGTKDPLKHQDGYLEELVRFILYFSKFGQDYTKQALNKAIQHKSSRILVMFLASLKSQQSAKVIMIQMMKDPVLWQRDVCWFFTVSQIIKRYPKMDYSQYFPSLFQQIIKTFTLMIDPLTNQDLKKITQNDSCLNIRSILKSIACLLSNLLMPSTYPVSEYVWNSLQRIFNIIITTLNHNTQPPFILEQLQFMRAFVKYFLLRYRRQRKLFIEKNQDFVEDFHGQIVQSQLIIDDELKNKFNSLWIQIIPKILFYQQQQSMSSKIIVDLCMFQPDFFLPLTLTSIKNVLRRQDINMISIYSSKMCILFLYDFIFIDKKQYISQILQIFSILLQIISNLGIAQNLDILQLTFRGYIYMDQQTLDSHQMETIIQDSIDLILNNLDSMSISLQDNQNQQSQLYIDLTNIFFPFFVKLDQSIINKFSQKFKYKILNQIPQHRQAWELITIIMAYVDPKFTHSLFNQIYKRLITKNSNNSHQNNIDNKNKQNGQNKRKDSKVFEQKSKYYFFQNIEQQLSIKNQSHIKWYTNIVQCLYQYHPQMIVRDFNQIQKIFIVLLKQWQNSSLAQTAFDIIFNLLICLCHVHFDWKQFNKKQNNYYQTLDINWQRETEETMQLLLYIYNKYFIGLIEFMKKRYDGKISKGQQSYVEYNIKNKSFMISNKDLKLVDSLLIPDVSNKTQDIQQKKLIYKVLSLQYTILSALMVRCSPFPSSNKENKSFFTNSQLINIRKTAIQYMQWIGQLLQSYNILWQPNNIKLYNYFWRQSLDQVYFTTALTSSIEKLAPYYYSQMHRRKELLRSSFLILNESYIIYTARIQFLIDLHPVAYMNHPQYLKKQLILGLHHHFDSSLKSYIPNQLINLHQIHRKIMLICRYHIDPSNINSYSYLYIHSKQKRQKQRYLIALKMLLTNIKKNQNPLNYQCCIKDEFILDSLISTVELFKTFVNKIDKMLVIDLFYLMFVFGFDFNLIGQRKIYNVKQQFQTISNTQQTNSLSKMKTMINIDFSEQSHPYAQCQSTNKNNINNNVDNIEFDQQYETQLKKKQSFRSPQHISKKMTKKVQQFINYILNKFSHPKYIQDKDSVIYCLSMIMFSKFLALSNPIFQQIIQILIKLTKSKIVQLFDISKTGLFHLINRFNTLKRTITVVENKPVKRCFEEFLVFRYLGGSPKDNKDLQYYQNIVMDKHDNHFYPSKYIYFYQYHSLGNDKQSQTYNNESVMLKFLTNHKQLKQFIIACSHDKDLKQNQTQLDTSMFEQTFTGIIANGHKLLNYVLDSNPKRNDIFASFIQNFSLYPMNFYPRMLRKLIRMGNQETINNLISIAKQLRLSNEIQQKKMSLYISSQLLAVLSTQHQFSQQYINFLATSSNDIFDFSTQCIFHMFSKNFVLSLKIYKAFIKRFRQQKGSSRLRHLTLMNIFMMSQGRFSRQVAQQGIQHLLQGIQQGSNQVSDVIVTMIVSCFIIAINLKQLPEWIQQNPLSLIRNNKMFKINQWIAYQIDDSLKKILKDIMDKIHLQKNIQSKNLKIYSKIANKLLSSISVYRYNQSFYQTLKDLIYYVVQKVPQQGQTDQQIIVQLKDSEYPQDIFSDLISNLKNMNDNPLSVIKKNQNTLKVW